MLGRVTWTALFPLVIFLSNGFMSGLVYLPQTILSKPESNILAVEKHLIIKWTYTKNQDKPQAPGRVWFFSCSVFNISAWVLGHLLLSYIPPHTVFSFTISDNRGC